MCLFLELLSGFEPPTSSLPIKVYNADFSLYYYTFQKSGITLGITLHDFFDF